MKQENDEKANFCDAALAELNAASLYDTQTWALRRLNAAGFATTGSQNYSDSTPSDIQARIGGKVVTLGQRSQQREWVSGWVFSTHAHRIEQHLSQHPLVDVCHPFVRHRRPESNRDDRYRVQVEGLEDQDECVTRYLDDHELWNANTFGCLGLGADVGDFLSDAMPCSSMLIDSPLKAFVEKAGLRSPGNFRRLSFHSMLWGKPHPTFWDDVVNLFEKVPLVVS